MQHTLFMTCRSHCVLASFCQYEANHISHNPDTHRRRDSFCYYIWLLKKNTTYALDNSEKCISYTQNDTIQCNMQIERDIIKQFKEWNDCSCRQGESHEDVSSDIQGIPVGKRPEILWIHRIIGWDSPPDRHHSQQTTQLIIEPLSKDHLSLIWWQFCFFMLKHCMSWRIMQKNRRFARKACIFKVGSPFILSDIRLYHCQLSSCYFVNL